MTGVRSRFLLVIAAAACLAASAWAEGIFPVNDRGAGPTPWVFDQPSVVANGSVLHVAFVGDSTAGADTTNTRLYYAAVNGSANFASKSTTGNQVRITAPVAIDGAAGYFDARHPQIALRSAAEAVILFQARPSPGAGYKLFRARVTLDNNAVTSQRVDMILSASGADFLDALTDPSFSLVTADNTLRVAFSSSPSIVAGPSYADVYFARVGLDTAQVLDNTLILLSTAGSTGTSPHPRLRLDASNNSHVVWSANNNAAESPAGIYYAMVKTVPPSVVDTLAIGATQVLSGGYRWGFPNVILANSGNLLWVIAADEPFGSTGLAGSLGISEINPYAVTHDGNPVNVNNVGSNSLFFINPPGGAVLPPDFSAYRPEGTIDGFSRLHVAGYGYRGASPPYLGTPGRYYAMALGTTATTGTVTSFASMVSTPVPVGLGDQAHAMQIPGDYTRPAFVRFNGKAVHFWSGPDDVLAGDAGARNLYVTSTADSTDPVTPTQQSGCAMVAAGDPGETGRIPGAAVLLLPAALLALRRVGRKAFGGR
ncbi:MAG: hypothetical protein H6Q79_2414 [Deltaproteobacteria bacterium]|nr:hypothetical protein [Deltaproteobacteria bacterium]MBP2686917.1 hypothetical protein [Deltaproteobacteria bacterium]